MPGVCLGKTNCMGCGVHPQLCYTGLVTPKTSSLKTYSTPSPFSFFFFHCSNVLMLVFFATNTTISVIGTVSSSTIATVVLTTEN